MSRFVALTLVLLVIASCSSGATPAETSITSPAAATTTTSTTTTTSSTTTTTTTEAVPEGSEVTISFVLDENTDTGTFTVAGPAVDEGLICLSGTTIEVRGEQGSEGWELSDVEYTCEDGSGTFTVESRYQGKAQGDGTVEESGTWDISRGSGSGTYEQLSGSGTMEGTVRFRETDKFYPTDASEVFTGYISINS